MLTGLKLKAYLAANAAANPEDVIAAKTALKNLGLYEPLEWGITEYPDRALFDAIKAFQKGTQLRVDGVMKPGGETETSLKTAADLVRRHGRNGDALLAHINPREARLLKRHGGSGTINPATELLEFSKTNNDNDKKEGEYIWHTQGDGNVRDSHADNDGKTFSWDSPPETGHPGEDYNCRCWAEDVEDDKYKCERILWEVEAAWKRHDDLHEPILKAEQKLSVSDSVLEDLKSELTEVQYQMRMFLIPDRPGKLIRRGNIIGWGASAIEYEQLQEREEQLIRDIEIEERANAKAKEELEKLESEREDHALNAQELKRQYDACLEEQGGQQQRQ